MSKYGGGDLLSPRYSFENWVVYEGNRLAYEAALARLGMDERGPSEYVSGVVVYRRSVGGQDHNSHFNAQGSWPVLGECEHVRWR